MTIRVLIHDVEDIAYLIEQVEEAFGVDIEIEEEIGRAHV